MTNAVKIRDFYSKITTNTSVKAFYPLDKGITLLFLEEKTSEKAVMSLKIRVLMKFKDIKVSSVRYIPKS